MEMGNEVWYGTVVGDRAFGYTVREISVRSPKGRVTATPPVGATVAVVSLADYYAVERKADAAPAPDEPATEEECRERLDAEGQRLVDFAEIGDHCDRLLAICDGFLSRTEAALDAEAEGGE